MQCKRWRAVAASGGVAAVLVAVLVAAGPGSTQEQGTVERDGSGWVERIDRSVEAAAGGTLTVATDRGRIRVATWEQDRVRAQITKRADVFTEGEARRRFEAYQVSVTSQEARVSVSARADGDRPRGLEVDVVLTVPTRFSVDLRTAGGDVEVGDLHGDVKAVTAGGRIGIGLIAAGSVAVQTAGGDIAIAGITGGDGQAETAGGGIEVGDVSGDLAARTAGGDITTGAVGGKLTASTAGGGIHIGAGGASVQAETAGGDIRVDRAGGDVRVQTSGGGIQVGPSTGTVEAETLGGDVEVGVAGGSVKARTSGGSIAVLGSGGPVEARTAGGSVAVSQARGAIEAATAGGSIEAELATSDPAVDTHCSLETVGGDVSIRLPADLAATIDAAIDLERPRREYQIDSDFPLAIERGAQVTARGAINGGGDLIRLRTTNADIHIRRR